MTIKVKNIHDNYSHYYYFYDKFIALIKIFNNHKIYLREAISWMLFILQLFLFLFINISTNPEKCTIIEKIIKKLKCLLFYLFKYR